MLPEHAAVWETMSVSRELIKFVGNGNKRALEYIIKSTSVLINLYSKIFSTLQFQRVFNFQLIHMG